MNPTPSLHPTIVPSGQNPAIHAFGEEVVFRRIPLAAKEAPALNEAAAWRALKATHPKFGRQGVSWVRIGGILHHYSCASDTPPQNNFACSAPSFRRFTSGLSHGITTSGPANGWKSHLPFPARNSAISSDRSNAGMRSFVITLEQPGGVVKSKQGKVVALAKG